MPPKAKPKPKPKPKSKRSASCKIPLPAELPPPEPLAKKPRRSYLFKENGCLMDGLTLRPLKAKDVRFAFRMFKKNEERHTENTKSLMQGFKEHEARELKKRLKLLREGDDEAYKMMLANSSDDRYKVIAEKTDSILESLGIKKENMDFEVLPQPAVFIGVVLKPYQLEGMSWMYNNYKKGLSCVLADEMGLGKTAQTIALMCLVDTEQQYKHLVVAPLSTLDNWVAEFKRMAPHYNVLKYHGPKAARRELSARIAKGSFDVVVTQYATLQNIRLSDMLKTLQRVDWRYVIVDEGHKLNNTQTTFSKNVRSLAAPRRLLLTGTPLQNDVLELWALLNFLMPVLFPKSVSFDEWFTVDKKVQTEEEKLLLARRLHGLLRPFLLRREKNNVLTQLARKKVHTVHVALTPMQRLLYSQAVEHKVIGPMMHEETTSLEQTSYMTLRKICNHPYLVLPGRIPLSFYNQYLVSCSGKLRVLSRILTRLKVTHHKCLVFTQFTSVLNVLEDFFDSAFGWSVGKEFCRLDGSVALDSRREEIDRFQTCDECHVFILSTRAGGQGINLQAADTVVFFDMDWNPMQDMQATARAHRLGQLNEVRIFRLLTGAPVEQHMHDVAEEKVEYEALAIKAGMYDQKSTLGQRDQRMKEVLQMHANNDSADVTADEELDKMLARNDKDLELFAQIRDETVLLAEVPSLFAEAQERAIVRNNNNKPLTMKEMAAIKLPPRRGNRTNQDNNNVTYPGLGLVAYADESSDTSSSSSSE